MSRKMFILSSREFLEGYSLNSKGCDARHCTDIFDILHVVFGEEEDTKQRVASLALVPDLVGARREQWRV